MLLEQIRQATAANHEKLENQLIPFLHSMQAKDEYSLLLQSFYGYIYPVQEKINTYIDATIVPDINQRRNAALISNDLAGLGTGFTQTKSPELPAIDNHAAAMGALYVLEGSTLGGKMISKMITDKLGSDTSVAFFSGYGAETGPMWKKFIGYLEHPSHKAGSEAILTAASETFRLFGTWLEDNLSYTNKA